MLAYVFQSVKRQSWVSLQFGWSHFLFPARNRNLARNLNLCGGIDCDEDYDYDYERVFTNPNVHKL